MQTLREVHDHLLLYTEQDKVTIPLHAFPPRAIITFDKFLRLGTNLVGNNVARFVTFSNSGSRAVRCVAVRSRVACITAVGNRSELVLGRVSSVLTRGRTSL